MATTRREEPREATRANSRCHVPGFQGKFDTAIFTAETDRAYADGGHSLDFINKAFECLDIIGWEHAADVLPSVVGQMVAARGAEV